MTEKRITLNVVIPKELLDRLEREAWFRHLTKSKLVRQLLTEALKNVPQGEEAERKAFGVLLSAEEVESLIQQGYTLESKEWVQPELFETI